MPHPAPPESPSAPEAWAPVPARRGSPSATSHHRQSQAEARAPWRLIRCFVWAWDKGAQGQPASCRGVGGGRDQPPQDGAGQLGQNQWAQELAVPGDVTVALGHRGPLVPTALPWHLLGSR